MIVIGNWEKAKLSEPKRGGKNYISMNRESLKNGLLHPKVANL